jgi:carboxyl-terminal processing protease
MDSPSPVPSPAGFVVKNGLKIFSWMSDGMPVPLSRMRTSTLSPRFRVTAFSFGSKPLPAAPESLLSQGALKDADALIWDLRDGWGGARPEYLDVFNARAPTMQVTDRSGTSEFVNVKWRKPVAMLINGGTRSGKEVLAYGFKKYGLGELIGTRTEGAVLAATAFLIGSGLLLLAVEDVRVDGERLEGVAVTPTIEVQAGAASAGSDDPQLSRAVGVLSGT